jgi:hypothetical protein
MGMVDLMAIDKQDYKNLDIIDHSKTEERQITGYLTFLLQYL